MSRPAVMYVSQFADPNSYRKETWRRVLGQDDECLAIEALLDSAGVLKFADYIPVRAHLGDTFPDISGVSAIILGGSFASVSDDFIWQRTIANWLLKIRPFNKPLLGICGGHQMMVSVLGGRVEKIPEGPEVGSLPIVLTSEGESHPLFAGFETAPKFYFGNFDRVTVPDRGAVVLATRPHLPAAALDHGGGWLSIQFHPELTCDRMATCWMEREPERAEAYSFIVGCERLILNFLRHAGIANALDHYQPRRFLQAE